LRQATGQTMMLPNYSGDFRQKAKDKNA
jgi:hypothetical protein